ncbi:MAG: hypothetical protein D6761_13850 [Candidatus Dadabacteria bacterium]|nr:MAG: hypothetical protein D6761_13850 [Candidatus Dadabacteria bacterium]
MRRDAPAEPNAFGISGSSVEGRQKGLGDALQQLIRTFVEMSTATAPTIRRGLPPCPPDDADECAVNHEVRDVNEKRLVKDRKQQTGQAARRLADHQRFHQQPALAWSRADAPGEYGHDGHVRRAEPEPEAVRQMWRRGQSEPRPRSIQGVDRAVGKQKEQRAGDGEGNGKHAEQRTQ